MYSIDVCVLCVVIPRSQCVGASAFTVHSAYACKSVVSRNVSILAQHTRAYASQPPSLSPVDLAVVCIT